jgi:small subunit ribosomal protein S20
MANLKSAQKQARQAKKRRAVNLQRKTAIKSATKSVLAAIEAGQFDKAQELLRDVEAKLARAKSKDVIHRKTASRKVSRLAKQIAKAQKK